MIAMIRTGNQYLDSIRDGREVYINGGRVKDVTRHPMMRPLIDIRARIYDMQHEAPSPELLAYQEDGEWNAVANKLPRAQADWTDKRGAKYETAAPYANQAFVKPTNANWGSSALSDYAVGFICDLGSPNIKFICRTGFAGRAPKEDYPSANQFDEVDALVIFDNVLIPWENVLFYRHTKAASFIRSTLHRYSAFAFVQRVLKLADMMIGAALFNVRQTGLDKQQAVQEKLAELAVYREGINAHLTASIALAERSPGGLMMPNQSLLFTGRVLASSQLHHMMHIARELCGGQICVTPDKAAFDAPETKPWLDKYYTVNEGWLSEDRRKLLAFARDLLNSDNAGHRLTFQLFAQSAPFANLAAVYRNFDWDGPLTFVQRSAGLSDRVLAAADRKPFDKAPAQLLAAPANKEAAEKIIRGVP